MKNNQPVTGHERVYDEGCSIISTTDLKGVITYVNTDFVDICGFSEQALVGKNHNVVRHPDMPPAAFEDLWGTIKAGRSWTGIVKNRCKNGDHYWVKAFVAPIMSEGEIVGYQSVRSRPSRAEINGAEALYRKVRDGRAMLPPSRGTLRGYEILLAGQAFGTAVAAGCAAWYVGAPWPIALLLAVVAGDLAAVLGFPFVQLFYCRPFHRSEKYLDTMGQGDLSVRPPFMSKLLAGRFNELLRRGHLLQARLRTVLGMIGEISMDLASAGVDLSNHADDALDHLREHRNETEQVATAVQQMAMATQRTAERAGEVERYTNAGTSGLERAIGQVEALGREVGEVGERIGQLSASALEVGAVVKIIRSIADQTNLLALNAAIEAARAGDEGRGFAVVADEVRELSTKTSEATTRIDAMIETLQGETSEAVAMVGATVERAQDTIRRTRATGDAFTEIRVAVGEIGGMSAQVAAAAEEQAQVAQEISGHVGRLSEAAAATTEQAVMVQRAGAIVGRTIERLRKTEAQFKLSAGGRLDLSSAKLAHLTWRSRLRSFLDGRDDLPRSKAVDHHQCEFGQWYDAQTELVQRNQALRDVAGPHKAIHALIREIIELKSRGNEERAEEKYREVVALSEKIVGLLNRAEEEHNR